MKYKIAVFGSAAGDMSALPQAVLVGEVLGEYTDSVIVITGACPGLPYAAAKAAAAKGAEVWGYSSSPGKAAQMREYTDDDLSVYKKIIYVPQDFPFAHNDLVAKKYRNVISSANCDAAIIISGLWGTLNEFTDAIDMQKPVGVLTCTGGVADELPNLVSKITKPGQGEVIFENDPKLLIEKLLNKLKNNSY